MHIPLKQYWDLLIKYLRPQRTKVLLMTLLLFSGIGLQLINPQILRYFIDAARSGEALQTLTIVALLFLGFALLKHLLTIAVTYISESVGWTSTNALRADLALHCLRLDMSFHNAHTPGELIERIDGDVQVLANFFSKFVIQVMGNIILLVGVLVALALEGPWVGLAGMGVICATSAILYFMRNLTPSAWEAERQANSNLFGFLEERLSGIEDIRTRGATAYVMRRLYQLLRTHLQSTRKAWMLFTLVLVATGMAQVLSEGLSFSLGAYLLRSGVITIGTVYLLFHYISMLFTPLDGIAEELRDLQRATASIRRVEELYGNKSQIREGRGTELPSDALSVKFQGVSFGYTQERTVLKDISFGLAPGKVLGVLGRTGSGKTTMTRLLFRLYDPTQGVICLNGVDIRELHLPKLRERVGMVTQDIQLFHATVRDNLTFFDKSIPDEQILPVLNELGLWTWYKSLSAGLDTELAAGRSNLSVGEAQLLTFTRVFLKAPGLVILDEASSHIDPATEALIENAIDRLLQNRTCIIIAHRLKTVQRADEILILEDGQLLEHGERRRLESDQHSRFNRLLQAGLEEVLV